VEIPTMGKRQQQWGKTMGKDKPDEELDSRWIG
jgi:hypothetical protein